METMNTGLSLIAKVKRTQVEMLRDRGYDVLEEEEFLLHTPREDIEALTRSFRTYFERLQKEAGDSLSALDNVYRKGDKTIHVYYLDVGRSSKPRNRKVYVEQIRAVVSKFTEDGTTHAILISETEPNPAALNALEGIKSIYIERFLFTELGYNPTKHVLVSGHVLLSHEEALRVTQKYPVEKLPIISHQDIQAKYWGARIGEIFRIDRKTLGYEAFVSAEITYRIVSQVSITPLTGKGQARLPFSSEES